MLIDSTINLKLGDLSQSLERLKSSLIPLENYLNKVSSDWEEAMLSKIVNQGGGRLAAAALISVYDTKLEVDAFKIRTIRPVELPYAAQLLSQLKTDRDWEKRRKRVYLKLWRCANRPSAQLTRIKTLKRKSRLSRQARRKQASY